MIYLIYYNSQITRFQRVLSYRLEWLSRYRAQPSMLDTNLILVYKAFLGLTVHGRINLYIELTRP